MHDFRLYRELNNFIQLHPMTSFISFCEKKNVPGLHFPLNIIPFIRCLVPLYLFAMLIYFPLPIYVDICSVSFCSDSLENILIIVVYLVSGYNGYINTLSFCPLTIRSTRYDSFHFSSFTTFYRRCSFVFARSRRMWRPIFFYFILVVSISYFFFRISHNKLYGIEIIGH